MIYFNLAYIFFVTGFVIFGICQNIKNYNKSRRKIHISKLTKNNGNNA